MKRLSLLFASFFLAIVSVFVASPVSHANHDHVFRKWDYQIQLHEDGWADVELNFTLDFGSSGGHGPYIIFTTKQTLSDDPDHYWVMKYKDVSVSSSTGAPAKLEKEKESYTLALKIGEEGKRVYGPQDYTVKYRVYGLINPNNKESGMDEFNFQAIGGAGNVKYESVTATVTGPGEVLRAESFIGGSTEGIPQTVSGSTVIFEAHDIAASDTVQFVAGYPAGTFNAKPSLEKRPNLRNMLTPNPPGIIGGIVIAAGATGLVVMLVSRHGRDQYYAGLIPGLMPAPGQQVAVTSSKQKVPVAVQFTPPKGARPGELGVLMDEKADTVDVTAMIISMAVRGYLKIDQQAKKKWAFVKSQKINPQDSLSPAEQKVYDQFFSSGKTVITNKDLEDEKYANFMNYAKNELYRDVMRKGWFKESPREARVKAIVGGIGLMIVGGAIAWGMGWFFGLGLWGVGIVVAGLVMALMSGKMPARTATGSAVLAQAKGFELFLTTADADRLRWEEGEDIFSNYLPYAIVFGCADKWASVFETLARRGQYNMQPSWYYSYHSDLSFLYIASAISNTLNASIATAVSKAAAAASSSSSSSGGSGFGGGGGFGGTSGGSW